MVLFRRLLTLMTACFLVTFPAYAGGSVVCVVHDRSLHLNLNATYNYGVGDSVTGATGTAEVRLPATPDALRAYALSSDMIRNVGIDGKSIQFDIVKSAPINGRFFEASIHISGQRLVTDKTTIRGGYKLRLQKSGPIDSSNPLPDKAASPVKPIASAAGYAECSVN